MSDVSVTFNNTTIAELDGTGIIRLLTSGTWMDGDILVQYEQPQSGPDASGLDAVPADVASGKTFIGANGISETGTALGIIYGSYTPPSAGSVTFEVDVGTSVASKIKCVAWWCSVSNPPAISGMSSKYPVLYGVMPCVQTVGTNAGFTIYNGVSIINRGVSTTTAFSQSNTSYASGVDTTNGKVRIGTNGSTYAFTVNGDDPKPYYYAIIYN